RGELTSARGHFEQGSALYNPQAHGALASLFGQDFGVSCLSYGAWVLCALGYPDHALARGQEGLALAQELAHPYSTALALTLMALVHRIRREEDLAQKRSEEAIALSLKEGFPLWLNLGTAIRGWVLSVQAQHQEGLAHLHQSVADMQTDGVQQGYSM